jgi:hypothetical protein
MLLACLPLIETPAATCADPSILEAGMMGLLNTCTVAALATTNRRMASGIDTPQVADMVMSPTSTFNQTGGPGRRLRERRLSNMCYTTGYISFMLYIWCCYQPNKPSWCGSPTNTNRRELQDDDRPSPADVEADLLLITAECTTQYQALAKEAQYTGCFAVAGSEDDLKCTAMVVTGGGGVQ